MTEIVFVDDGRILGGGQLFALRLARWLDAQGADVPSPSIACPATSELAERARAAGIPVRDISFPDLSIGGAPHAPSAIRHTASLLRDARSRNAIVVANAPRVQAFAAAARLLVRGAPAVVNLAHEQDTAARASAKLVLGGVGRVVAVGANTAAAYERTLPRQRIGRLNNFLDPLDLDRALAQRTGRAGDGPPVVGVLARLIPEKGLVELVQELASCPDAWSTLRIGGGAQDAEYAAQLAATIGRLDLGSRVELLGHVNDLPAFFGQIGALVVPSTGHEAQPTVILEALAYGVPVVVREPIWSGDFAGLPVSRYTTGDELGRALSVRADPAPGDDLRHRFGPEQALDALVAAAEAR